MALKTLSKTNISNGNIVQAADVSQNVDAFTGIEGYAITLSGSLTLTGSQDITGSISASSGAGTIGFFGTSSWAVSASQAVSASYADAASAPIAVYGASYPSASAPVPSTLFKFIGGADKTGNPTPTVAVTVNEILGKTLGQDCFVTATVSGSGAQSVVINGLVGSVLTFETQNPDTNFFYHILYI